MHAATWWNASPPAAAAGETARAARLPAPGKAPLCLARSGGAQDGLTGPAAADPTREAGYDWTGAKVYVSPLSRFGQEMESKYGYKRWLHGAELIHDYPPTWDAFDGDDP
jgi:hypothetical protein